MQLEMIGVTGMNQDIKQSNTRFWLLCLHKEGVCVKERKLHFLFWWRGLYGTPGLCRTRRSILFFYGRPPLGAWHRARHVWIFVCQINAIHVFAEKDKKFTPSCSNNGSSTRCEWWVWRGADMQICKKKSTLKKRTKKDCVKERALHTVMGERGIWWLRLTQTKQKPQEPSSAVRIAVPKLSSVLERQRYFYFFSGGTFWQLKLHWVHRQREPNKNNQTGQPTGQPTALEKKN